MILNFKPQFKGQILNGQKIHSIRTDEHRRWKAGNKIHFATGARTKYYNQFWYGHCKNVQDISIERRLKSDGTITSVIEVDGRRLTDPEVMELVANDGFYDDRYAFMQFFIPRNQLVVLLLADSELYGATEMSLTYCARLIHWTNKLY